MEAIAILAGDGPARRIAIDEAAGYSGPGFVWIHSDTLDQTVAEWVQRQADIPNIIKSALTAVETRPRCDEMENGALINLRGLAEEEDHEGDRLVSVRLWARQCRVHSLSRRPLAATRDVMAQMEADQILDSGDLVAAFARAIARQLDPEIAALGDALDDCESQLEPHLAYKLRGAIARIRSDAIAYRRFVAPDRDAMTTLTQLPFDWLAHDDRMHIREAADGFARMAEELEAVRERAALIHEQLTDLRGELMESRALLISVVALVFLPLTFVTGLFGMNVGGIPLHDDGQAFWHITSACFALTAAIAVYFVRIHWFRG